MAVCKVGRTNSSVDREKTQVAVELGQPFIVDREDSDIRLVITNPPVDGGQLDPSSDVPDVDLSVQAFFVTDHMSSRDHERVPEDPPIFGAVTLVNAKQEA